MPTVGTFAPMRSLPPVRYVAAAAALLCAQILPAQCPNGTPPPCTTGTAALVRRPNPALSTHTWVVVPFTNATRSPDLEWLRDGAVNLLTLDLGRWSDIRVVDDKRVGDLVRELPAARAAQPLTLGDGLAIARRAGAGMLVMGDYFKAGKGTRFVVNVFDVERGTRVRSYVQQAPEQDSLLTAFGPIARGVLAVPPPAGARLGVPGTTRTDAYQEYLLGTTALNRFEITTATTHLRRALALDSSFALAHYKLAIAIHWDGADTSEATHALAAARLAGGLPSRERALINARVALTNGEYERACDASRALVAKDSTDVEALYAVGECEYHGGRVAGTPGDSAHRRFRGNWNVAIRSFRRVLALDPTYHPAFAHILDALTPPYVVACVTVRPGCGNEPTSLSAPIVRDGDSLIIHAVHVGDPEFRVLLERATANRTPLLNFQLVRSIAQDWVEASQRGPRALVSLGQADIQLGDLAAAEAALAQVRPDADRDTRVEAIEWRLQGAAQRGDGALGRALLDSMRLLLLTAADSGLHASHSATFGRLRPAEARIRQAAAREHWSPERLTYTLQLPRIMLGVPNQALANDEHRYWSTLPGDSVCDAGLSRCRTAAISASLAFAARIERNWWPPLHAPSSYRLVVAEALAAHDGAKMTEALRYLDSTSRARLRMFGDEGSLTIIAADGALAMGDSVGALARLRFATDSILPFQYNSGTGVSAAGLYFKPLAAPRVMLQRADLEAAIGSPADAKLWYGRVLDLWADADPELQPTVARIRAARERLAARR